MAARNVVAAVVLDDGPLALARTLQLFVADAVVVVVEHNVQYLYALLVEVERKFAWLVREKFSVELRTSMVLKFWRHAFLLDLFAL